jgi:glycosyltransferase involved in cell wall biosynthesis
MPITVVNVAYPLVPIGHDTVGGTEQVITMLDEALVRRGHRSIVIGAEGSMIAGTLISTPAADKPVGKATWDWAYGIHRDILHRLLSEVSVDVVHLHGVDLSCLPESGPPALMTLHLPAFNYPKNIHRLERPLTFVNCVSGISRAQYPADAPLVTIPYGVRLDRFRPGLSKKEDFILALGRIVPEKGFHLALDAAKQARLPLILAGKVPPFPEHQEYFEREIRPRLDDKRRFVGALPLSDRVELLQKARCLVVPSFMFETGPLVAMEAQACGTPVIARPAGALPENVEDRRTGFIVDDVHSMAQAMHEVGRLIDPEECRRVAVRRFDSERMAARYLDLYEMIAGLSALEGEWPSRREVTLAGPTHPGA